MGGRYAITGSLEFSTACYHQSQNDDTNLDCALQRARGQCAGTMDTASAPIDWKFAPKWDTCLGTQYTQSDGGFNRGYLSSNNRVTTAGIRFRW